MPVSVAFDKDGQPTALLKKLAALGFGANVVPSWSATGRQGREPVLRPQAPGAMLADGLQKALDETLAKLPIPKVMTYQLADGWTNVKFVRPAHRLVALHGAEVVPVSALGISAGRATLGHRFQAKSATITIRDADSYADAAGRQGAVIAVRRTPRRDRAPAGRAAAKQGLTPIHARRCSTRSRPGGMAERAPCRFEDEFLAVPQECLILTMKANQKYFPLSTPRAS